MPASIINMQKDFCIAQYILSFAESIDIAANCKNKDLTSYYFIVKHSLFSRR